MLIWFHKFHPYSSLSNSSFCLVLIHKSLNKEWLWTDIFLIYVLYQWQIKEHVKNTKNAIFTEVAFFSQRHCGFVCLWLNPERSWPEWSVLGDGTLIACGNSWPYFRDYNNSIDQTHFGLKCDEMRRRCNIQGCPFQLGKLDLKFLTFNPYIYMYIYI